MLSECGEAAALAPWALSPVPAASAQLLGTEPGEEAGGGLDKKLLSLDGCWGVTSGPRGPVVKVNGVSLLPTVSCGFRLG